MKVIKPGLPLVFIARVHFLNNSLHNLVKILMYQIYLRKTYWDSIENLKKRLPSKHKFFNSFANRSISDKNHVINVWKACKMNTMKDYCVCNYCDYCDCQCFWTN